MATVKLLFDPKSNDVLVIPFARDPIGTSRASGATLRFSEEDFQKNAADVISELANEFYTRDHTVPSELYEEMEADLRNAILKSHVQMSLSKLKKNSFAKIYMGQNLDFVEEIDYPFDGDSFGEKLLQLFRQYVSKR